MFLHWWRWRKNAELNQLDNVQFWHADLSADFSAMPWAQEGFNKVLLDPARAGAAQVMSHIVARYPQKKLCMFPVIRPR